MKVRFQTLILIAVVAGATFLFSSSLTAQVNYARIVFVDAAKALAAHPAAASVEAIQQRQEEELNPILTQIQGLQQKAQAGQPLTSEEQDLGDILLRTLQDRQQRYADEILSASEPAVQSVNRAIQSIAQSQGYSMVFDGNVAGQNGLNLIVYAEPGLDVTDQVINFVRSNP